jgi:hypothetical protein
MTWVATDTTFWSENMDEREGPLGGCRHRWKNGIKLVLEEMKYEVVT